MGGVELLGFFGCLSGWNCLNVCNRVYIVRYSYCVLFIVILVVNQIVSEDAMFLVGLAGFMSSIFCCICVIGGKSERDLVLFYGDNFSVFFCSFSLYYKIALSAGVQSRFAAAALLFVTSV